MNPIFKKIIPHIVAIAVFAVVSMMFFAPQYQGKVLSQGDMLRANGMAVDVKEHVQTYDEHPAWAGRMFGGMPAYLIDMDYEGRWVKSSTDFIYDILGKPASFLFIAMAAFYLMLVLMGVNPYLAIAGGLGYGLSTYFPIIIEAGHITKMMALAWIPALIGAIWYAYRKNKYMGASLAAFFAAIEISCSHPQITYYFLFVIVGLVIAEFVRAYKTKMLKAFAITSAYLVVAATLAVGANLVQLYYVQDYSKDSTRSQSELTSKNTTDNSTSGLDKDYATQWSYGKSETLNLFVPNAFGQSSSGGFSEDGEVAQSLKKYQAANMATSLPSYWGDQPFTEGGVYIGALLIFLFVFAICLLPSQEKWWVLGPMILALLLAWGHNLMWLTDLFLDYFPLYNKFRVPSMILVVIEFGVPLLALLALNKVVNGEVERTKVMKALKLSTYIAGGLALFAALVLPSAMEFVGASDAHMGLPKDVLAAMVDERASMLRSDSVRSLLFVAIGAALIWAWVSGKLKKNYFVAAVILAVLVDMVGVDRRFVSWDDFQPNKVVATVQPTELDKQILKDTTDYRVANFSVNPFSDAMTSYFHRSVGGYHAAKMRRYQELIDNHLSKMNIEVYNMLNTKYFITEKGVEMNDGFAGSAWIVDSVIIVETADAELNALSMDAGFKAKDVAIVDKEFAELLPAMTEDKHHGFIRLTDYKVNNITYQYGSDTPSLALFSEIYYPKGWTAYVDGKEVPSIRANYILRALNLPAGNHTIEWKYEVPNYSVTVNLTRTSSLLILLSLLATVAMAVIRKRKTIETEK